MEHTYHIVPALAAVRHLVELGGEVLVLIAVLTLFMWALIFERLLYLVGGHAKAVDQALTRWKSRSEHASWHAHKIRERLISVVSQDLERNLRLIRTCVAVCPLMGLLGTVTGMIEVFDVLAIIGSSNSRSMAAGVSKATVPTMAGMVAALSGFAVSVYLQKKAQREKELLKEHMTMEP